MTCSATSNRHGSVGAARYRIDQGPADHAMVTVCRAYPAGLAPSTADRVWRAVSDFGAIKALFPSLLRVYLTYPDEGATRVGLIRDMTFAPPPSGRELAFGIEQLVALDERQRTLAYTSVLGLPLQDYRSEMAVTGDDACELVWQSTCRVAPGNAAFLDTLASILAGGANQIANHLGLP
jgi:hypothetical protein